MIKKSGIQIMSDKENGIQIMNDKENGIQIMNDQESVGNYPWKRRRQ